VALRVAALSRLASVRQHGDVAVVTALLDDETHASRRPRILLSRHVPATMEAGANSPAGCRALRELG